MMAEIFGGADVAAVAASGRRPGQPADRRLQLPQRRRLASTRCESHWHDRAANRPVTGSDSVPLDGVRCSSWAASSPVRSPASCSATTAPTSSRSRTRTTAIRCGRGVSRSTATACGGRRSRATSGRSPSTCATPAAREVVRRLAANCDIVVENFRPGRLDEWGLTYDGAVARQPGARRGAHQRLRPDRPAVERGRVRQHRRGDGRHPPHDRQPGPSADPGRRIARRCARGDVRRHRRPRRADRGPRRPARGRWSTSPSTKPSPR